MPTTRKRHSITETDRVERALNRLREERVSIDLPDLVVRGADEKLRELQGERADDVARAELRERFLERSLSGEGIDAQALLEVRATGWTHH